MAKIYRTTDRIKVNIHDMCFSLSPLTISQKREIQGHLYQAVKEQDLLSAQEAAMLSIKYSVKSVKGLYDQNNEEYQLEFDGGFLSDNCVQDLMNIESNETLANVCNSLLYGIQNPLVDPLTGKEIQGVSFEEKSSEKKNLEESIS